MSPGEDFVEPMGLLLYLLLAPVWAVVAAAIARRRGLPVFTWAALGFFFAIPAVLCATFASPRRERR